MLMLSLTAGMACSRIKVSALAAWPALDRIHDVMMLPMGVMKHVVHLLEIALVERQRLRTRKRDAAVALERGVDDGAPRLPARMSEWKRSFMSA